MGQTKGITFDCYRTLLDHRDGLGRGRCYQEYLSSRGLEADPWDHQVLYGVFDFYADKYNPAATEIQKRQFWTEFTGRLFARTHVADVQPDEAVEHAEAIRDIFGPSHFRLYPEVQPVLENLKTRGFRLGVASNWQRGLNYFCDELGISEYLDLVMPSAEIAYEKPDPCFFQEVVRRMKLPAGQITHVGDSLEDDINGATSAGLRSILLDRENEVPVDEVTKIRDLTELAAMVD